MSREPAFDFRRLPSLILNSLNVIFNRAFKDKREPKENDQSKTSFRVLDKKKDESLREGLVQDAEFGLILLSMREWLRQHATLTGPVSDAQNVQAVAVAMVESIVDRVLKHPRPSEDDGGVQAEDVAFFSSRPYSYAYRGKWRERVFPANLDSAMLVLAFLALALEEYDAVLKNCPWKNERDELQWTNSLRDAALFVCREAIGYATRCQVRNDGRLEGYTCDPVNRDSDSLLDKHDRLFFTWTACETIRDLRGWVSYLEDLGPEEGREVSRLAQEIRNELSNLDLSIAEAGNWCQRSFLSSFDQIHPIDVSAIVRRQTENPIDRKEAERSEEIKALSHYIQHVYHFSQYIAIRSLSTSIITIGELKSVSGRLNALVKRDILESKLDESDDAVLFEILTRSYSLGFQDDAYPDDGWYPLVVRSLAAVLRRVPDDFRGRPEADEFIKVMRDEILPFHLGMLVARRPKWVREGDEHLWSNVADKEYVFYATQRSIFALAKSFEAIESTESGGNVDELRTRLRGVLAESIADTLLGSSFGRLVGEARKILGTESSQPAGQSEALIPAALAEPQWAGPAITRWLDRLTSEIHEQEKALEPFLNQNARSLVKFHEFALEFKDADDESPNAAKILKVLDQVKKCDWIGEKLSLLEDSGEWSVDTVLPLLFEYLFHQYVNCDASSLEDLVKNRSEVRTGLWDLINQAKIIQRSGNRQGASGRRTRAK